MRTLIFLDLMLTVFFVPSKSSRICCMFLCFFHSFVVPDLLADVSFDLCLFFLVHGFPFIDRCFEFVVFQYFSSPLFQCRQSSPSSGRSLPFAWCCCCFQLLCLFVRSCCTGFFFSCVAVVLAPFSCVFSAIPVSSCDVDAVSEALKWSASFRSRFAFLMLK